MREIKFRVWDTVTKKMYLDVGLFPNSSNAFEENNYEGFFINPSRNGVFKLMQFTGLHDKNGNPIWEGDILRPLDVIRSPYKVYWGNYGWEVENIKDIFFKWQFLWDHSWEVIGNIYENPELLEVL